MLKLGSLSFSSRLIIGSGKFSSQAMMPDVLAASGTEIVTLALRRIDLDASLESILTHIPDHYQLLPNTSGAKDAQEAVRIARLARSMGCGNMIKVEVIHDSKYLFPDNSETVKATEILAAEGFIVLPYMNPDLVVARQLVKAGAAAVMPLGAPIGSNRGMRTKEMIRILIEEIDLPIIVDAGLGKPSDACEAMEMGAAAVMVNTAIATAEHPTLMAEAFRRATEAGHLGFLAKLGPKSHHAVASSPLTGFLGSGL
jgi:thiazole synthase